MAMPEYPTTIKLIASWKIKDGEAVTLLSDNLEDISAVKQHRKGAEYYPKLSKYSSHRYLALRKGYIYIAAARLFGYFCTIEATSK